MGFQFKGAIGGYFGMLQGPGFRVSSWELPALRSVYGDQEV